MKCPNCDEDMELEYRELGEEEWTCPDCQLWIEKVDGEIVRKILLTDKGG